MVYVGIYALIYLHIILGEGIVSRDGLPRGVLPSGILKIEKYCPGLKVRSPLSSSMKLRSCYSFQSYRLPWSNLNRPSPTGVIGSVNILVPVYIQCILS